MVALCNFIEHYILRKLRELLKKMSSNLIEAMPKQRKERLLAPKASTLCLNPQVSFIVDGI